MNCTNIGFLGLGLIGGSIARAVKAAHPQTTIQVYTRRKNPALETGIKEGVIDYLHYSPDKWLTSCDIIFLCAPVLKNIDFLSIIKPFLKNNCIITDVGSVKGNIHTAAEQLGMAENFIGGHPMAGSEKTGYANSSPDLLENSYYLLTPSPLTSKESLDTLCELLSCTGSQCVVLSPEEHDNITAAISHVPHLIAATLVNMVRENDSSKEYMKQFAAGGFRDITRIASSSPEMWENICLSNKESIAFFLSYYIESLKKVQTWVETGNSDKIHNLFETAGKYRSSLEQPSEAKENPSQKS